MTFLEILEIAKALGTFLMALIAAWIAYKQFVVNRQKVAMDLYERRLKIYKEIRNILSIIVRKTNVELKDSTQFYWECMEADFLFANDITNYIDLVYKKCVDLCMHNEILATSDDAEQIALSSKIIHDILMWSFEENIALKGKFKKYLPFQKLI